jgi:hypothetical protein
MRLANRYLHTKNKILIKFNNKLSKLVEINKGVHQGCPLSPTLFNIYLDEIITKWQKQSELNFQKKCIFNIYLDEIITKWQKQSELNFQKNVSLVYI